MTDTTDIATEEGDWDVTPDGLYIATRYFLTKRGYCCANRCRNCPYINWRDNPDWRHVAHQYVRNVRVSPKAIDAAHALYIYHKQQEEQKEQKESGDFEEASKHEELALHYAFLLKMWRKE